MADIARKSEQVNQITEKHLASLGDLKEASEAKREDETYLTDLGTLCSQKSEDFKQRSQLRDDEIAVINKAR